MQITPTMLCKNKTARCRQQTLRGEYWYKRREDVRQQGHIDKTTSNLNGWPRENSAVCLCQFPLFSAHRDFDVWWVAVVDSGQRGG
jgi:hypothetical protein